MLRTQWGHESLLPQTVFLLRLHQAVDTIDRKKNWSADWTLLQSLQKVPVHRAPESRYPDGDSEHMETKLQKVRVS